MGCSNSSPVKEVDNAFEEELIGVNFNEQDVVLGNGSKRRLLHWKPAENIKGVVIIVHGLHDHSLRYSKFAKILTEQEFAVFGMDNIGHGGSEGVRGLITDFRILSEDLLSLIQYIKAINEFSSKPLFIFCHSLGTLQTIKSIKSLTDITAIVFSGTPIFPGYASASPFGLKILYPLATSSLALPVLYVTSSIDKLGPAGPILRSELSYDQACIDKSVIDKRHYKGEIRNRTAYETLLVTKEVKELVKEITLPFLVLHGKDDVISLHKGSEYIYENAATPHDKKTLLIIPDCKHEIVFEKDPVGIDAIAKIINYFDSFIPSIDKDSQSNTIRVSSFKIN